MKFVCIVGNAKIAKWIVAARLNGKIPWPWLTAHIYRGGNKELVEFAETHGPKRHNEEYKLYSACRGGHADIVWSLLRKNPVIDWTKAIAKACVSGNMELVKRLIEKSKLHNNPTRHHRRILIIFFHLLIF